MPFSIFWALYHIPVELTCVNSVAVIIPYLCLLLALGYYYAFAAVVYMDYSYRIKLLDSGEHASVARYQPLFLLSVPLSLQPFCGEHSCTSVWVSLFIYTFSV